MSENNNHSESDRNVLVNVDKSHRGQLQNITQELESAGMKVEEVFSIGGTIAGKVSDNDLNKLHEVEGVSSVEDEPTFST